MGVRVEEFILDKKSSSCIDNLLLNLIAYDHPRYKYKIILTDNPKLVARSIGNLDIEVYSTSILRDIRYETYDDTAFL